MPLFLHGEGGRKKEKVGVARDYCRTQKETPTTKEEERGSSRPGPGDMERLRSETR
jgi:hypothetical protein